MPRIIYTPEKKAEIVKKAASIGAAAAAKEAGVGYQTVLKWVKETASPAVANAGKKITNATEDVIADLDEKINSVQQEIDQLTEAINVKKTELKALQKEKSKAEKILEKENEIRKAAEEKEQILEALVKSNKSLDDILAFLK